VPRLVGTPWGRQGDGELTRQVREQPFSVVLLDEIEKAHWLVFDALLAMLGEGRLTDAAGRTTDFRNAIIILTSNLGATRQDASGLGFLAGDAVEGEAERVRRHYIDEAEGFFRPEFFNRLDRVVAFRALDEATVRRIARRELGKLLLREGVVRRRLLVEIDDAVVEALARRGFHPRYGARPLQREVERAVIRPLAQLLVEQRPDPGDLVRVHLKADEVAVEIRPVELPAAPPAARRRREQPEDTSLARAVAEVEELVQRIDAEEATPAVHQLRAEKSGLVAETHEPTFWDEPDAARTTLSRIYQVEQVLDRLDALRRRAHGLLEMGRHLRASRDRPRLPELRLAADEIDEALLLTRVELAGAAAAGDAAAAVVRVTPIGADAGRWADELLVMYEAWAVRTGRDAVTGGGPGGRVLTISGLSSYDLLAPEAGLHRRLVADGGSPLARVSVAREQTGGAPGQPTDEEALDGAGTIVRVYDSSRHRAVRDPRTGVRVKDPDRVLREGRIDAFLLAGLRRRSSPST
jgi:ATP-dependent Clp protease ATP-binding subunit ClpC